MSLSDEELAALFLAPSRLQILSDEDLMAALRMGCNDALAVLFERHSALVFRIARAILHDDGEAEETVQRVFLDVFRAVNQFNPDRGSFKTWLLQYAYHRNRSYKNSCWTSPDPACRPRGSALTGRLLLDQESSAGVL